MRTFYMAYCTIVRNIRDKKGLSLMLLLPLAVTLILGTALKGFFKVRDFDSIQVCYINWDKGNISKYFDDFLDSKEIKDMLTVKKVESFDEGKKLVNDKKMSALIVINENYSEDIEAGKKANIEVYTGKYSNFSVSVVKNIIDSYIEGANAASAMQRLKASEFNYIRTDNIEEVPITTNGKIPRAIDYYAVTMLVMTIMYGTSYGCHGIGVDYLGKKGRRVKATPIKPYEQFVGIALGNIITVMCQSVILILFTKYAYGANWGNNMLGVLLISFSFSALAIGIGIMFTVLIKDTGKASSLLSLIVPLMTFLAGGFAKIEAGSTGFAKIMYLSPNYLAHTALFNTIYGQPITTNIQLLSTKDCVGVMWFMTIVMFLIASIKGRRDMA